MLTERARPDFIPVDLSVCAASWHLETFCHDWFGDQGLYVPNALAAAVPKRQAEFLVGRYCARQAIARAGGRSEECLRILDDRSPEWPERFVGAITHTEGFAAACVSTLRVHHGVGIDTEVLVSAELAHKLSTVVLTEPEIAQLDQPPCDLAAESYFSMLFSAKESIYKCLRPRVGAFFGFDTATLVSVAPGAAGELDLRFSLESPILKESGAPETIRVRAAIESPYVHTFAEWRQQDARVGAYETA